MRGLYLSLIGCAAALAVACGGSKPPAQSPEPPAPAPEPPAASAPAASASPGESDTKAPDDATSDADKGDDGSSDDGASDDSDKPKKIEEKTVEPKFIDGMSVDQAIAAVPQGLPRENEGEDELSKPLTSFKLYAPCKPRSNEHFKVRVAIWNGKAVGVDVSTKPKNKKLAACIDKQVRGVTWKDPVKSLNTISYQF